MCAASGNLDRSGGMGRINNIVDIASIGVGAGFARCRRALAWLAAGALTLGLLAGCASPPPPATVVKAAPTRMERVTAALKAMSFKEEDDGWHLSLPAPLLFEFDREIVSSLPRDTLLKISRELTALDVARVLVRGHTDNVGSAEYNLALSKRRADAIARVLVDGGYPAARMDARGMGWTVPVADNATIEGRAQNRRVVIIVQID